MGVVAPLPDVDALVELLERSEAIADAEPVDLLAHGLQTAALLAERAPTDTELQLAGLVHDVGWLLGASAHEHASAGAEAVAPLLGGRVARLVEHHVDAKRYLAAVEPERALTARSRETLALQGGSMAPEAVARFEADPEAEAFVALRRADDAAKVPGAVVAGLERWRPLLDRAAATCR